MRAGHLRSAMRRWSRAILPRLAAGLTAADIRALARGAPLPRPDPRLRARITSFWLHIKPAYYHDAVTPFRYTFRLGLLSIYLFAIECVTGVLLMIPYAPTPERAHGDVLRITSVVPFGALLRDVHRLAAECMVVAVALHLARTYLTASYKPPRRFTWVTGVVLLVATLAATFTGYLLPWDQLAYWAATITAGIVALVPPAALGTALAGVVFGGTEIGADGLTRFYTWHVLLVPGVIVAAYAAHYYKVVRLGISLPASEEAIGGDSARRVPVHRRRYALPDVLSSELLFLAATTALLLAVIVVGIYPGAPLEGHADPLQTPLHSRAPWFFRWIQGLLTLGDPRLMGVAVPIALLVALLLVPVLDRNPSRRARDRRGAIGLFAGVGLALLALTWLGTRASAGDVAPAARAIEGIAPEAGGGALRAVAWDAITIGEWDTRTYAISTASPELRAVMARFADLVGAAEPSVTRDGADARSSGHGKLIVEPWGPGLKKVIARVVWVRSSGAETVYERSFFVHRDAAGAGHG